ncbi:hypothetical protein JVT61DRAFT_3448 [Boletus reticuloceps]|uniref:Flavin reductase like domain-containing protein n=1 Tax=Boletus reticuloceps TaxID=495285 RepID=A0A8I2YM07_9AGAM|nr:hypothetical protein JVT61DRAFT_3448 [Boletus reticuloceps]
MSLPPFDRTTQTQFTEAPNPTWAYCQPLDSTPAGRAWLEGEEQGWQVINTEEYDQKVLNKLMLSGIVPRPVAFVSTISEGGVENLAPFRYILIIASILFGILIVVFSQSCSWFNMVANWPLLVSFSCLNGPARIKDTTNNVKNSKGFTVNIISEPFVENADVTAIDSPPGFDEWSISGLTKAPSVRQLKPISCARHSIQECELFQAIDIVHPTTGECTSTLILAHVNYIHVRNDMLTERGTVDPIKFKPVARLGDISYVRFGDIFRIPHPVWATEESNIQAAIQHRQL